LAIYSKSGAVRNLADLAKADRLAIANPVHAPYGLAARQVLEGRGLWDQMRARIVYAENIRQTLQFAESGNVDAALVAWSLVVGRPGAVLLDDKLHAPIRQAGGIVAASRRRDRARALLDFLTGPEGRRLLERNGFSPPDPPR
jgi:molybdate transport system substrate-binding protein